MKTKQEIKKILHEMEENYTIGKKYLLTKKQLIEKLEKFQADWETDFEEFVNDGSVTICKVGTKYMVITRCG